MSFQGLLDVTNTLICFDNKQEEKKKVWHRFEIENKERNVRWLGFNKSFSWNLILNEKEK